MADNTELVKANASMGFDSNGNGTTLDLAEDVDRDKFIVALNAAKSLAKYEKKLVVCHVVIKPGVRSRTNEPCQDVYLILKNGDVVFTQSVGILKSVRNLLFVYGNDLSSGIPVRVESIMLDNGNEYKTLVPDKK